jgi:hypothetical protein
MGRLVDTGAAKRAAAERRAARGETRAWTFNYQIGQVLRDGDDLYEITGLPDADRRDRVVMVRRFVLDSMKRPLAGLRERPFLARAEKDGIRVGQGRLARRVPVEAA